ncbi:MAG: RluA family pseudouridine synthase [Lewinellaceae bacterium]|nr:RluA family pseudouridine synthase [Phaeodactylibacter sp.]MCB9350583.1 RluA family pseudouridine synthase [Lewinellaceae bacterium]
MRPIESHIVPPGTARERLSDYAHRVFQSVPSRKGMKKAIKAGAIFVDGRPGHTGHWVLPGQRIELMPPAQAPPKALALPLEVLYEDTHLALINKPAGLPTSGNRYRTVVNALQYNLSPSEATDALPWPRPVHRLDALTSGLLLIAKSHSAAMNLGQQFEEKGVRKTYQAVAVGKTAAKGTVKKAIDGQEAMTEFRLLRQVPSLQAEWLSLLELYPRTGRTHQLRRHLAGIGHPILGDGLYTGDGLLLKGKGLFLSAVALEFTHPISRQTLNFTIQPPKKFKSFLDRTERRWKQFNRD